MTPRERQQYRKMLEAARGQAVAAAPAKIEPNRTDAVSVGVADEDAQALSEMMQTLASQKNRRQGEHLGQIARALEKIAKAPDDYGLCEECEEDIAERRLELMPYATLCTECQGERDPRRGESRKSLTDFKR